MTARIEPTIEPWAQDRAIDIIALVHGSPSHAEAVRAVALILMLTHTQGELVRAQHITTLVRESRP